MRSKDGKSATPGSTNTTVADSNHPSSRRQPELRSCGTGSNSTNILEDIEIESAFVAVDAPGLKSPESMDMKRSQSDTTQRQVQWYGHKLQRDDGKSSEK